MSAQEIIRELAKLNRDELTQVDLRLHELLQEKIRPGGKSWGEALLEVAGTVEGLPPDYAENHDHYLHFVRRNERTRHHRFPDKRSPFRAGRVSSSAEGLRTRVFWHAAQAQPKWAHEWEHMSARPVETRGTAHLATLI
jgi:hypothetical protein